MQTGKRYKKLDEVMAYRIAAAAPQANGSYSATLEALTGAQLFTISSDVVKAGQAPPEAGDFLVFPDHVRGYAHYLVERAVFEQNYQEIPEPTKGTTQP
jgi:hypothetical protein